MIHRIAPAIVVVIVFGAAHAAVPDADQSAVAVPDSKGAGDDVRLQRGEELACPTPIPRELSVRDVRALLAAVRLRSRQPVRQIFRSSEPCEVKAPPSTGERLPGRSSARTAPSINYSSSPPSLAEAECVKPPVPTYAVVVIATGDCTAGEGDKFHARRLKRTWRVQLFGKRSSAWGMSGGGAVH
jgi:hypothetical protein